MQKIVVNKQSWPIFFVIIVIVVSGLVSFRMYQSLQSEKKIRLQKESELMQKIAELGAKEIKIREIGKEKTDLESLLSAKTAELEEAIQKYKNVEGRTQSQAQDIQELKKQVEVLLSESYAKDQLLVEMNKKIEVLTAEKADLSVNLQKFEDARSESDKKTAEDQAQAAFEEANNIPPKIDAVKLGNIVVQKDTGAAVRVQNVNKIYNFIVLNAGSDDGIKKDAVLNIIRGNHLVGKAIVEKVKKNTAAAITLPEYTKEPVQVGDFISKF